jgi:hypothetical protein
MGSCRATDRQLQRDQGAVTSLNEDRWTELCRRIGQEKDPEKRITILAEIEIAAREEQEQLKLKLRPHVQRYRVLTRKASASEAAE